MTRRHNNHITIETAGKRGMTLLQWCEHEAAEEALDAIEQARGERIVYALILMVAACSTIAILAMDGLC